MQVKNDQAACFVVAAARHKTAHQVRPGADEGHIVGNGGFGHLLQRLDHIVHIHVAEQDAQGEAALQLPYAEVDVVRLQQMIPAQGRQLSACASPCGRLVFCMIPC